MVFHPSLVLYISLSLRFHYDYSLPSVSVYTLGQWLSYASTYENNRATYTVSPCFFPVLSPFVPASCTVLCIVPHVMSCFSL
jgi:hypothetical protein